jgi:hypothetical protein
MVFEHTLAGLVTAGLLGADLTAAPRISLRSCGLHGDWRFR